VREKVKDFLSCVLVCIVFLAILIIHPFYPVPPYPKPPYPTLYPLQTPPPVAYCAPLNITVIDKLNGSCLNTGVVHVFRQGGSIPVETLMLNSSTMTVKKYCSGDKLFLYYDGRGIRSSLKVELPYAYSEKYVKPSFLIPFEVVKPPPRLLSWILLPNATWIHGEVLRDSSLLAKGKASLSYYILIPDENFGFEPYTAPFDNVYPEREALLCFVVRTSFGARPSVVGNGVQKTYGDDEKDIYVFKPGFFARWVVGKPGQGGRFIDEGLLKIPLEIDASNMSEGATLFINVTLAYHDSFKFLETHGRSINGTITYNLTSIVLYKPES
jgi:hypothetical protein